MLQGVEMIDGAWRIDSTGNFAFLPVRGVTALSAIFDFTVTSSGTTLRAIP